MRRFAHLAHAACAPDAASEAVIRRAHQLLLTQRNAEAEELLRDVDGDALPVPARSQVLSMRATNLFWPLANPAAAAELVDNALHATDPVMAHPARANKALQLALSGRPRKALHVLERADPTLLDDISAVCRCRAAAAALGDRGQVDAAITASRDAARIAARNPRAAAHAMGVAEHAVTAAVAVGRLADAHTIAAELLEQTRDSPGIAHSVALAVSARIGAGRHRQAPAHGHAGPARGVPGQLRRELSIPDRRNPGARPFRRPGGRPYHRGPDAPDQTSRLRVHRPGCGARERGHRRRRRPVGAGAHPEPNRGPRCARPRSARARGRLPPGGRPVR